jgi:hypothetical protein
MLPVESGSGYTFAAGQAISGTTGSSSTAPDTLNIRFQALSTDNGSPFNCLGQSAPTAGASAVYESQFWVSGGNLVCSTGSNGAAVSGSTVLIDGVSNMKVYYGVDTQNTGYVTEYLSASGVNSKASYWFLVRSIQVVLTFSTTTMTQAPQPYSQIFQVKYGEASK